MLILAIRTDKPEAEIALLEDAVVRGQIHWIAHRELASTLHTKIIDVLKANSKVLGDIEALVVYEGPGSFTGVRIGVTVANALAGSLDIPIVGATDSHWQTEGVEKLGSQPESAYAIPVYDRPAATTPQKK
ncbi:hypothetical protein BH23PAT2_BH23PAT2_02850 [soil metagenome]